jgi:hypothetical protein
MCLNLMHYVKLVVPLHWDDQLYAIWRRSTQLFLQQNVKYCSFAASQLQQTVFCLRGSEVNCIWQHGNSFSTVKEKLLQLVMFQQPVLPRCCQKCYYLVKKTCRKNDSSFVLNSHYVWQNRSLEIEGCIKNVL